MWVQLPKSTARIVALRLAGWNADAIVCTDALSPTALRQLSPLTRAGVDAPVAVWLPGSQTAMLYPTPVGNEVPVLEKAILVVDEPDVFRLDSVAFNDLKMRI